ncbi:MAG: type II toxin-antitoxin system VapC family toxin [Acidobacteriota bacterium]
MLILDSTLLAECLKPSPDPQVGKWLATQDVESAYTTSLAQADLLFGVQRLAPGKRRTELAQAISDILDRFEGRILSFDPDAARAYPQIVLDRNLLGRPISETEAMIAAITRSRGATLVTRHEHDFAGCGIRVVSPWASI